MGPEPSDFDAEFSRRMRCAAGVVGRHAISPWQHECASPRRLWRANAWMSSNKDGKRGEGLRASEAGFCLRDVPETGRRWGLEVLRQQLSLGPAPPYKRRGAIS